MSVNPVWFKAAWQELRVLAVQQPTVKADEVWNALGTRVDTPEHRAMGGVFKYAQELGWIEPTTQHVTCTREVRHKGTVRIWVSKLYGQKRLLATI